MDATHSTFKNPSWWKEEHTSGWDRVKEALHRDWQQTKADFSDGGEELNQGVGDTVRQASGKEHIPPRGFANPAMSPDHSPGSTWDTAEPALRYGYGARQYYGDEDWNEELEAKLRRDWDADGDRGAWEKVKDAVRRGWESVRSTV